MNKIILEADSVSMRGPGVDGGFSVTFKLGEYQRENVAILTALPNPGDLGKVLQISVEMAEPSHRDE